MPESRPIVSIITPTYRHGDFLRSAVNSVLRQTYEDWELLIREDGPADPAALEGIDDPRIRYSGQTPRGIWQLKDTYNELLGEAQGELIAILEGDDSWPDDKLAQQVEVHRRHPDVIVSFGEALRIDERGRELSRWGLDGLPLHEPFDALPYLVKGCPIAAVTAMIRRDALLRVDGFSQPAAMPAVDYPTWLKLAGEGPFLASPTILGHWRVHKANASSEHILALARGNRSIALDHAPVETQKAVARYWDLVEGDVQRSIGRLALQQRSWRDARRSFAGAARLHAWRRPTAFGKAIAGWTLATLHISVPPAKARGR